MLGARFRFRARVLANAAEAGQLTRAVRIHRTLCGIPYRNLFARKLCIPGVARWAAAARLMVVHTALRVRCTVARIATLFVLARLVVRAFVVARTLRPRAADQWISSVPIDAVAAGVMVVVRLAHGVAAALRMAARVDTVPVDARLRRRAVTVAAASNFVAGQLCVTRVAFAASTDRTVELDATLGVLRAQARTDGARVLALAVDARLVVGALTVAGTLWLWLWRFVPLHRALHER